MTITVEPLAIGSLDGPRVWILTRRVGTHLDVGEMPDEVTNEAEARTFASSHWNVPECDVTIKPVQIVEI